MKDLIQKAKKSPILLATYFIQDHKDMIIHNHDLYVFNGKYYSELKEIELNKMIMDFFTDNDIITSWTSTKSGEIIKAMFALRAIPEVELNSVTNLQNFNNGVLNLDTMEFHKHSKDFYFSWCLNVDYNKTAGPNCPHFLEFLNSIFHNDQEVIQNIIRLGGYLLYPQNKIEGLFIFIGNGNNGKSFLIEIFCLFFPEEFVTPVSLVQMSKEESKHREQIVDSILNISGEEKGGKINAEQIKKISSGQTISVNRMYKKSIKIKPKCKLLVDGNSMLYFDDTSYGTERRLHLFKFPCKFVPKEKFDQIVQPERQKIKLKKDHDVMFNEIKAELPVILNLFLLGLQSLRKAGWVFPSTKNSRDMMEEYKETSDTIGAFLLTNFKITTKDMVFETVDTMYNEFRQYYYDNFGDKKCNYSKIKFTKAIRELYRIDSFTKNSYDTVTGRRKLDTCFPLKRIEVEINEIENYGF